MKNIIKVFMLIMTGVVMAGCEDFTDVQPKGENLLMSTEDLGLLLNTDLYEGLTSMDNLLIGDNIIYAYSDVSAPLAATNKTRNALIHGYFDDENSLERLASLTNYDDQYFGCYSIINRVCNPILNQLSLASGSEDEKKALRAEALVARAFCHYLVLQRFAPAYNGQNENSPAIIYMTEDKSITKPWPKNTLKDCYDQILQDINDALDLNILPSKALNYMRWDKTSALALKAHALMGMHNYSEAEAIAKQVLSINGSLYDYYAHAQSAVSLGGVPYYFLSGFDDRRNDETLFLVPSTNFYLWVCPDEWNALEEDYGRRGLVSTMGKQYNGYNYHGVDYSDYGSYFALPGWQAATNYSDYMNTAGLSTPQMYLIVAECELRAGNIDNAMEWIDKLRSKRMPEGTEMLKGKITGQAAAQKTLMSTVSAEYLWTDWAYITRKRWNVESAWKTTLTRTIAGITYTLRPESKLWISPFPENATGYNPNLTQNW